MVTKLTGQGASKKHPYIYLHDFNCSRYHLRHTIYQQVLHSAVNQGGDNPQNRSCSCAAMTVGDAAALFHHAQHFSARTFKKNTHTHAQTHNDVGKYDTLGC